MSDDDSKIGRDEGEDLGLLNVGDDMVLLLLGAIGWLIEEGDDSIVGEDSMGLLLGWLVIIVVDVVDV